MQIWAQKRTEMVWKTEAEAEDIRRGGKNTQKNCTKAEAETEAEDIRRGGKNTQKNCTKKIFMTQIIMMV